MPELTPTCANLPPDHQHSPDLTRVTTSAQATPPHPHHHQYQVSLELSEVMSIAKGTGDYELSSVIAQLIILVNMFIISYVIMEKVFYE